MTSIPQDFLTFTLGNQLFGISVLQVNDILVAQKITATPLAQPAVAGVMNLRGRIVTAINMRRCLGQENASTEKSMNIVIEQNNELFSLIIDSVGDVITLDDETLEDVPATLPTHWQAVAAHIHKLDRDLMVILDTARLLDAAKQEGLA